MTTTDPALRALEEARRLIELGEQRAMAADGDIPHFRGELDDREWRQLWKALSALAAAEAAPLDVGLRERLHAFLDDEGNHVGGVWGDYGEIVVSVGMVRDVIEGRVTPPATDEEWAYTNRDLAALAVTSREGAP